MLENDVALISLYQWGNMLCQTADFVCIGKKELSGGKSFFFLAVKKKKAEVIKALLPLTIDTTKNLHLINYLI